MSSVFNYFYFCRIRVVGIRIFEMSRQYDFMLRRFSAIILINNLNVMKDLQFFFWASIDVLQLVLTQYLNIS